MIKLDPRAYEIARQAQWEPRTASRRELRTANGQREMRAYEERREERIARRQRRAS